MMATTPYVRIDDAPLGPARAAAATATEGAGEVDTTGDTDHRTSTTAATTEERPIERSHDGTRKPRVREACNLGRLWEDISTSIASVAHQSGRHHASFSSTNTSAVAAVIRTLRGRAHLL